MEKSNLTCPLYVGFEYEGKKVQEIELLRSNGVAEKVFTEKLPDKSYSWMANVLTIAVKEIAGKPIGMPAREEHLKTRGFTVPKAILAITLADVNSLMIEIHRRVWQNLIPKQECICKYCGTKMLIDIDLEKFKLSDEDEQKLGQDFSELVCDLDFGWEFQALGQKDNQKYKEYEGVVFNRFIFRPPTLGDAIRHEKYSDDTIMFWRRVALDCLIRIEAVNGDAVTQELPVEIARFIGLNLFEKYIDSADLRKVRTILREELPQIPYYYEDECINTRCKRMTPVTMEAPNFFSE